MGRKKMRVCKKTPPALLQKKELALAKKITAEKRVAREAAFQQAMQNASEEKKRFLEANFHLRNMLEEKELALQIILPFFFRQVSLTKYLFIMRTPFAKQLGFPTGEDAFFRLENTNPWLVYTEIGKIVHA